MESTSRIKTYASLLMAFTVICGYAQTLPTDHYLTNLKNYTFKNTKGIADTPHKLKSMRVPENHEDPDPWIMPTDADIKALVEDRKIDIKFPDFSFQQVIDKDGNVQNRQRTHTVEHVVYAIPGDAISLYPYYGLDEYYNFNENFSHWYDFYNGGRVKYSTGTGPYYDLLSFPTVRGEEADHDMIQISDDYGFYGGVYMTPGTKNSIYDGYTKYEVNSVDDFINVVNQINNSANADKTHGIILINADLDFSGKTNVPMLGDKWEHKFCGVIEGNGHRIRNLIYNGPSGTGLIGCSGDYAVVRNLHIDNTCSFTGPNNVGGVVGFHAPSPSNGGSLTITSVRCDAQVKGTDLDNRCAGGLIGACNEPSTLTISNCYVGAKIGGSGEGENMHNAALIAWWQNGLNGGRDYSSSKVMLKNVVVNCTLYGSESGREYIRHCREREYISTDGEVKRRGDFTFIGCYGNINNEDECWSTITDGNLPTITGWTNSMTPPVAPSLEGNNGQYLLDHNIDNRNTANDKHCKAGTSAVFFFPNVDGIEKLPQEYVIAADYSQTFQLQNHVDVDKKEITEPLIAIRHIFRVKDGKEFADRVSGSLEKNREYIRRNRRFVTARADEDFQIRLQFPLPTNWGGSGGVSNFYYKTSGGEYKRIKKFGIRVLDGDTHKLPDTDEWADRGFEFGADIDMYRAKPNSTGEYPVNDGSVEFKYHTMLTSQARGAGHYIVQVIGKDDEGNPISLTGEGGTDYLVMMEYDINFVPESGAFIVTEDKLYTNDTYAKGRDANLKKKYGDPIYKINFDEYAKINKIKDNDQLKNLFLSSATYEYKDGDRANPYYVGTTSATSNGREKTFFKWPVRWDLSSYSFGYNYRHDYNMYMLATHSDNVPYHAAADGWNRNVADDGNGLFDRLYYKTKRQNEADRVTPVEQGYFYYVNAATDPGVSARLDIDIPCSGYRVVVSAWVAEFSPIVDENNDETSNISFNFVAVMNNGDRLILHNFITGYLPRTGEWLNVYYSFVPRLSEFYSDNMTFDDVEHFELELAHNGKKSSGADYAIDDIRAYLIPPAADAELPEYLCEDDKENTEVKLTTSFEVLMQKLGQPESYVQGQSKFDLYYAFVDKSEFDRTHDFNAAAVNLAENGDEALYYGSINVDCFYRGNEPIKDDQGNMKVLEQSKAYRNEQEDGTRLITFAEVLPPGALCPGKEYYVAFRSSLGGDDVPGEDPGTFFDITADCAYNCVIAVEANNVIKIDGVIQADADDITVCENQSPAIQVNIKSKKKVGGEFKEVKNARFDWFYGTLREFEGYTDGDDDHTLQYALKIFRAIYPEKETLTGVVVGTLTPQGDETLEEWMISLIRDAITPETQIDSEGGTEVVPAKLTLRQASCVLPPVDLNEGETDRKVYVTAIPIPDAYDAVQVEYDRAYDWCLSPTEVGVTIENKTPVLLHGLKDMPYPRHLVDVPLRVGLEQLYEDVNASACSRVVEIPVRLAGSVDEGVDRLVLQQDETPVILVQTNDPEYRHLGSLNEDGTEKGQLLWVGEMQSLTASTGSSNDGNCFKVSFDESFRFKEGYFYRMRFNFKEHKDSPADAVANAPVVCPGQDVFTLKIVPKYLLWHGGENLNFNNDDNWMRVHTDTLSAVNTASVRHRHFATNGANGNEGAYAPLGFTHVVVKDDVEAPYLFKPSVANTSVIDPSVMDATAAAGYGDVPAEGVGAASPLIQFDMEAYMADEGNGGEADTENRMVKCKRWQANTCKEIHFRPGATIMNQQELKYEKAWVEMEFDHQKWYTVSSPLQEVYAGDFYLPKASGRQETELFQDMTFDFENGVNDRFEPAVYQRGWDKSAATVYEIDGDGVADRNVIVEADWSHVYNDVTELYGGGIGFSIKTDVSAMEVDERPEKVKFRLPKADTEFWYYDKDGTPGHSIDFEDYRTDSQYRLNEFNSETGLLTVKATTANAGNYFLVGNPFMTHMDIAKFFEKNSDVLQPAFWIINGTGQIAGTVGEGGVVTADLEGDASFDALTPMQGFFVKTKNVAKVVTLKFDASMMRRATVDNTVSTQPARTAAVPSTLRITAINDGIASSSALIATGYGEDEMLSVEAFDNRALDLPSLVYTIGDGQALSINFRDNADGVEIGVAADPDKKTVLRFEGVDEAEGLSLLDKQEYSLASLYEGMEIEVSGAAAGRFFLTHASGVEEVYSGLEWSVSGNTLTAYDRSYSGHLEMKVYDTLGRAVASESTGGDSLSVELSRGVYVVEIANGVEWKSIKVRI